LLIESNITSQLEDRSKFDYSQVDTSLEFWYCDLSNTEFRNCCRFTLLSGVIDLQVYAVCFLKGESRVSIMVLI
jgi:hypothetical protein